MRKNIKLRLPMENGGQHSPILWVWAHVPHKPKMGKSPRPHGKLDANHRKTSSSWIQDILGAWPNSKELSLRYTMAMSVCVFCNICPLRFLQCLILCVFCQIWFPAFFAKSDPLCFMPSRNCWNLYCSLCPLHFIPCICCPKTPWSLNGQKMKIWILIHTKRVQIHGRPQEDTIEEKVRMEAPK